MSWRTGKNIIHEQNAFLCYCPLAKLSKMVGNLGWRLTLEKRTQIVLGVCFHHQRAFMHLEGSSISDLVVKNILTLQNYCRILNSFVTIPAFDSKLLSCFFFPIFNFETVKIGWKNTSSASEITPS